jgi:hypothetical protein
MTVNHEITLDTDDVEQASNINELDYENYIFYHVNPANYAVSRDVEITKEEVNMAIGDFILEGIPCNNKNCKTCLSNDPDTCIECFSDF